MKKTNTLTIIGFILAFFFPLVGLILCIIGLQQIKKRKEKGRELAIAGIIISSVFMLVILAFLVISIASFTQIATSY
jgi:uncharacterized membrane protein